jgi:hypothetical protein
VEKELSFSRGFPIYEGREKDQYDPGPDEKLVSVRSCGGGCVIQVIERKGFLARMGGLLGKRTKVEPLFRPLEERYPDDMITTTGSVKLKNNQRMVVRQGGRVFQYYP